MADLSDLLGDVYGEVTPAGPDDAPVPHEPPASARVPATPEWASDAALDAAFGDWTPGPPADAPKAERDVLLDDDLAAALSEALADTPAGPARRSRTDTDGWTAKPFTFVADPATLSLPDPPVVEVEVEAAAGAQADETEALVLAPAEPTPIVHRRWNRSDDDILPIGARPAGGKRFRLS